MPKETSKSEDYPYGPYATIWNCTGQFINMESTSTNVCGNPDSTVNGIECVAEYVNNFPFNNPMKFQDDSDMFKTGLFAQIPNSSIAPLAYHPLQSGSIVVNSSSGALEFQPGGSCQPSNPDAKPMRAKPAGRRRKSSGA